MAKINADEYFLYIGYIQILFFSCVAAELHVDEEGQLSSDSDVSDVDV